MEEILASIRRIIADDDATKSPPAAEAAKPAPPAPKALGASPRASSLPPIRAAEPEPSIPAPAEPRPEPESAVDEQSADILELTESMAAAPAPAASAPQFRTIDGASDVSFEDEAGRPAPPQISAEQESQLVSRSTRAAVDSAFNSLAQTVLVQNARTLEDLVREMLRPMLKSWLDENLPGLVERLVRAEIERVSRGH
jgi:cell pole-organizing protein PopZ